MTERLDEQLAKLRQTPTDMAMQRVHGKLNEHLSLERRHVAWAVAGAAVAATATAYFALNGDSIAFILAIVTLVLAATAWRTARRAADLADCDQPHWLAHWRRQLLSQLRQVQQGGPMIAAAFTLLTTWVAVRHGAQSAKTGLYALTCAAIWAYVAYQWLVTRPQLKRELQLLESDQ